MKIILFLAALGVCSFSFARKPDSAGLGQVESSFAQNDCSAPQIAACGPCFRACTMANASERGEIDFSQSATTKPQPGKASTVKH